MEGLRTLSLQPVYIKLEHDIAKHFYLPCLERAQTYDRAVGFFNSTIYVLAWSALKGFVERGGTMRLICCPMLTDADKQALREGYLARVEASEGERLRDEFRRMLATPTLEKPARLLAALITTGVVDVRLAFMDEEAEAKHRRLFHDKVGILTDHLSDRVVFKGSMNETYAGLANDGNLESVDVFTSWAGDWERLRVETEVAYFERLWENKYSSVRLRKVPEVAEQEFLKAADGHHWPDLLAEIVRSLSPAEASLPPQGRKPRPHQEAALAEWWKRGRRGILEHATGSGKTFTALLAIRDALQRGETPLILVPSSLLLAQWEREIRETLADLNPKLLVCGDGHDVWREPGMLRAFSRRSKDCRIILSTMQTAVRPAFMSGGLVQGPNLLMVADEVHRMGSAEHRKLLDLKTGPRLGLSATPHRAGDADGTAAVMAYFQGIVPPPYDIADAIRDGTLTKYIYRPYPVSLTDAEWEDWKRITNEVRRVYARYGKAEKPSPATADRIKQLLIRRSRIVKGAAGKVPLAVAVVQEHYRPGQHWIVYCDNQHQLGDVLKALRAAGIAANEYHTAMTGDLQQTLRYFTANGGVLVAIKCLDEGVDIPAVSHALILASSQNPREFIQRRGRVLRTMPGKYLAYIFDAIVLPDRDDGTGNDPGLAVLRAELVRAIEFGRHALNTTGVGDLERLAANLGCSLDQLQQGGYEDDE